MNIWLASADLVLLKEHLSSGVFAGVITNPRVIADAKCSPFRFFEEVCSFAPAAYYQLRDASADDMLTEAEKFLKVAPGKMRIKVPATRAGLQVISRLSQRGHEVMATAVPTTAWLIFALAAGARAVAPYGSTLQKQGQTGKVELVLKMQEIITRQESVAEICVGIYDVTDLAFYAAHGVRSCFIWGRDAEKFLTQPLVEEALSQFHNDWKAVDGY